MLRKSQDITAMTLNSDNTNLVVSTSDGQLLVFTDPAVSAFSVCLQNSLLILIYYCYYYFLSQCILRFMCGKTNLCWFEILMMSIKRVSVLCLFFFDVMFG